MTLTEQYRRFRAWQREPRRYSDKELSNHHCANCGYDFTGNYCPVCGQKASWGRITWDAVRENVMLLWGMDSHSMPYTLWQLLLRPGYLIGEYISGRRQVSYPPVKMLFLVAVFYAIIRQMFGLENEQPSPSQKDAEIIVDVINWLSSNPGWAMISVTMILILPTWILFRFAPRNTRHTLPASVFIQLFMSTLLLIIILITNISPWFLLLIPFYYFLCYQQLFGYRFWGIFWRLLLCALAWFLIVLNIIMLFWGINERENLNVILIMAIFSTVILAILLIIGYLISKRTYRIHYQRKENPSHQ